MTTFLSIFVFLFALCLVSINGLEDPGISKTIPPYIVIYKNGTITRYNAPNPSVPPPNTPEIRSKDITISSSPRVSARLFLPTGVRPGHRKLPVLLYFHGGAFCIGSPFTHDDTIYLQRLTVESQTLIVSIDYRLFPPYPLPAAYDDAWSALRFIAAASDSWLATHGDLHRIFVGGDSAGANIAHHIALRAGREALPNRVKLTGALLAMPYFLGSKRVPLEPGSIVNSPNTLVWRYVCPNCIHGLDNPYINPMGRGAPRLARLGIRKLVVYTAEMDDLRGRAIWYVKAVKRSGWKGETTVYEGVGEAHVFHILHPESPSTATLIKRFANFLSS